MTDEILTEEQQRRAAALEKAGSILRARNLMGAGAVEPLSVTVLADYILQDGDFAAPETDAEPGEEFTVEQLQDLRRQIFEQVGAASTCWSNLLAAGEFQSERAEQIGWNIFSIVFGEEAATFIRQHVPSDFTDNPLVAGQVFVPGKRATVVEDLHEKTREVAAFGEDEAVEPEHRPCCCPANASEPDPMCELHNRCKCGHVKKMHFLKEPPACFAIDLASEMTCGCLEFNLDEVEPF